jgi:mannose-6-phosphate isomerase-like protein (cupin superfamily)
MKRSEFLQALSRDHHQGLSVALALRRATPESVGEARRSFLSFWRTEGSNHFRVEEEVLLPAYARHRPAEEPAVVRVLVEHVELRRRAAELEAAESPSSSSLREVGELLEQHIRHEERVLFPAIEAAVPEPERGELARALERADASGPRPAAAMEVADLLGPQGSGPLWGMASNDLNATLLAWPPGHELPTHENTERDVLLVVLEGTGQVRVDGLEHEVSRGQAVLIPKGSSRAIRAGAEGVRYLSVHLLRPGVQIEGL